MKKSQCGFCLQQQQQEKSKQELKNYCPISKVIILKISERLLYDRMYKFFTENSLIS